MTATREKFFEYIGIGVCLMGALAVLALFVLVLESVDPWWSTGYNKSTLGEQLTALCFWVLLVAVGTLPFLFFTGRFNLGGRRDKVECAALREIAPDTRLLESIPICLKVGMMTMLVLLIDTSVELALAMAAMVSCVGLLCVLSLALICRARRYQNS